MNMILIPSNREDPSVIIPMEDLLKRYPKDEIDKALNEGTTIVFRGTKCFVDEALE